MRITRNPFALIICGCLLMHIMRAPLMLLHPQFWAEDGSIFFLHNYTMGPHAFFVTYAGYLHIWPRFWAFLTGFLPLYYIPLADKIVSLLTQFLLLLIICSERCPGTRWQKSVMMLATSLVPHGGEVFLNLANTVSFSPLFILLIAVSDSPKNLKESIFDCSSLLFAALSGPYVLFLLPLILGYFLTKGEGRRRLSQIMILAIGFMVQAFAFSIGARPVQTLNHDLGQWMAAVRKFFFPLIFSRVHVSTWFQFFVTFIIIGFIVMTFALSAKKRMPSKPSLLFFGALACYGAALFVNRSDPQGLDPFVAGARYFYAPYVLIIWGMILQVSDEKFKTPAYALISISFLTSLFFFHSIMPFDDLHWQQQVNEFEATGRAQMHILPKGWGDFVLDKSTRWQVR